MLKISREGPIGLTWKRRFLLVGWCAAMLTVTVLALLPGEVLPSILNWWDKAQHALAFVVLTGWAMLVWPRYVLRVMIGMLLFGAGIELAQLATGWRDGEWADLAADAVGICGAWWGSVAVAKVSASTRRVS